MRCAICAVPILALFAAPAMGANPLFISGVIDESDALAFEPDDPNPTLDFYYDLYEIEVDTEAEFDFSMTGVDTLPPFFALYAGDLNVNDWLDPLYLFAIGSDTPGDTIMTSITLVPGLTYQLMATTNDYNPDARLGAYRVSITGPDGSTIRLVPAPGVALALAVGALGRRRRR